MDLAFLKYRPMSARPRRLGREYERGEGKKQEGVVDHECLFNNELKRGTQFTDNSDQTNS